MKRFFNVLAKGFYFLGVGGLVVAHFYAAFLAYQYVYAWNVRRALVWVFLTFIVPILSTIVWFAIHWWQSGVFWNWLTLALAASLACFILGMVSEQIEQRSKT
jgi:fructose-specific phosphotransferase system IIC component